MKRPNLTFWIAKSSPLGFSFTFDKIRASSINYVSITLTAWIPKALEKTNV